MSLILKCMLILPLLISPACAGEVIRLKPWHAPMDPGSIEADIDSVTAYFLETIFLYVNDGDRGKAAQRFSAFASTFPDDDYAGTATDLEQQLKSLIESDKTWTEPADWHQLSVSNQVVYHIHHLRDLACSQWRWPDELHVLDYWNLANTNYHPAVELRNVGTNAVSQLMPLLGDRRPTRCVALWRPWRKSGWVLLRHQDLALEIVEAIAGRSFRPEGGMYYPSQCLDYEVREIVRRVSSWTLHEVPEDDLPLTSGTHRICGRVVDGALRPLQGALVRLSCVRCGETPEVIEFDTNVVSNAEGHFSILAPDKPGPLEYRRTVAKDGFCTNETTEIGSFWQNNDRIELLRSVVLTRDNLCRLTSTNADAVFTNLIEVLAQKWTIADSCALFEFGDTIKPALLKATHHPSRYVQWGAWSMLADIGYLQAQSRCDIQVRHPQTTIEEKNLPASIQKALDALTVRENVGEAVCLSQSENESATEARIRVQARESKSRTLHSYHVFFDKRSDLWSLRYYVKLN